jgi:hypothetical protein
VIDANGVIRWSYLSPVGVNPGADGILNALEALTPEQRGQPSATATATSATSGRSAQTINSSTQSNDSSTQSESSAG